MSKIKFWIIEELNTLDAEFPKRYNALDASIEKWKFMVAHPEIENSGGHSTCGLCRKYYMEDGDCHRCPVVKFYDVDSCEGTPFEDWARHSYGMSSGAIAERKKWAERELEFLEFIKQKVAEHESKKGL